MGTQQTINILIDGLLIGTNPPTKILKLSISPDENQKIDTLLVGLLRTLIVRLSASPDGTMIENTLYQLDDRKNNWYSNLHEVALVQSILSGTHHLIRFRQRPDFINANLSLLLTLARTHDGCNAILSNDLSQLLWLPLSSIKQGASKEWIPVFVGSIYLVSTLLRVGKQQAVDNSISFIAFLEEQLLSFLSTKSGTAGDYSIGVEFFLQENQMKLTSATASLIGLMMEYYKQWQLKHSISLNNAYQSMCALLHTSACLLIRPSVLKMLIGQNSRNKEKNDVSIGQVSAEILRARRRLSSKGAAGAEDSFNFDESGGSSDQCVVVDNIQNKLLDIVGSCLKMLLQLSPDLIALLTDALVDHASYIELLQMGFSSPTFEHDDAGVLTYGTIISISNLCIKNLVRTAPPKDNSSPPLTKSASTDSPEAANSTGGRSMDRRQLLLVLEQSLYLLLSQALLILSNEGGLSLREKQLLRRELGAELGSLTESMRRYVQKGLRTLSERKSPLLVGRGESSINTAAKSPIQNDRCSTPILAKSDEMFMKHLSEIVQKAFK